MAIFPDHPQGASAERVTRAADPAVAIVEDLRSEARRHVERAQELNQLADEFEVSGRLSRGISNASTEKLAHMLRVALVHMR